MPRSRHRFALLASLALVLGAAGILLRCSAEPDSPTGTPPGRTEEHAAVTPVQGPVGAPQIGSPAAPAPAPPRDDVTGRVEVVRGAVVLRATVRAEDLVVLVAPVAGSTARADSLRVGADHRFEFRPAVAVAHALSLVPRARPDTAPLATAIRRPGEPTVTLVVERRHVTATAMLTVRVTWDPSFVALLDAARERALQAGRQLAHAFADVWVQADGGDGIMYLSGSERIDASAVELSGQVRLPDLFTVHVRCTGLGLHQAFGPFAVGETGGRIECTLTSDAEVHVEVRGFGTVDLARNPVMLEVRDDAGRVVRRLYADDGARRRATIVARNLPAGTLSFCAFAGNENTASRPRVLAVRRGDRPSIQLELGPQVELTLRLDEHTEFVRELRVQDPVTGACRELRVGSGNSRPSCFVTPGRWRAVAVLWSGDVLHAHGDVIEAATWTLER
jgi:hypothetical protein